MLINRTANSSAKKKSHIHSLKLYLAEHTNQLSNKIRPVYMYLKKKTKKLNDIVQDTSNNLHL